MVQIHLSPLISIQPSSITISFFDIFFLVTFLFLAWSILAPETRPKSLRAHIHFLRTHHARVLPKGSDHAFTYPLVYFGFDLDDLEKGRINLSNGRLFSYNNSCKHRTRQFSFLSIDPSSYLTVPPTNGTTFPSIKSRLRDLLHFSPDQESKFKVYGLTMPSYFGGRLGGFNPLSIWFVYEDDSWTKLLRVVLEVHNTFGEGHAYVLEPGKEEQEYPQKRFKHEWIVPRAFHVSPFNDRSGYYQVSLNPPKLSRQDDEVSFPRLRLDPSINIEITILVPSSTSTTTTTTTNRTLVKKFRATLTTQKFQPLTEASVIKSLLFFYPFAFLLTTPRIIYQAAILHFGKPKLGVFKKPDMIVPDSETTTEGIETTDSEESLRLRQDPYNQAERGANPTGALFSTGNQEGWIQSATKQKIVRFVEERLRNINERSEGKMAFLVTFQSLDVSNPEKITLSSSGRVGKCLEDDITGSVSSRGISSSSTSRTSVFNTTKDHPAARHLILKHTTPQIFEDLFFSPSAELAWLLGSETEKRWDVNDKDLFFEIFRSMDSYNTTSFDSVCSYIRWSQLHWSLSTSQDHPSLDETEPKASSTNIAALYHQRHFLSGVPVSDLRLLLLSFVLERLSYWVLKRSFVKGMEPWGGWRRTFEKCFSSSDFVDGENSLVNNDDRGGSNGFLGSVAMK